MSFLQQLGQWLVTQGIGTLIGGAVGGGIFFLTNHVESAPPCIPPGSLQCQMEFAAAQASIKSDPMFWGLVIIGAIVGWCIQHFVVND